MDIKWLPGQQPRKHDSISLETETSAVLLRKYRHWTNAYGRSALAGRLEVAANWRNLTCTLQRDPEGPRDAAVGHSR